MVGDICIFGCHPDLADGIELASSILEMLAILVDFSTGGVGGHDHGGLVEMAC
jgi:hypothetical protein